MLVKKMINVLKILFLIIYLLVHSSFAFANQQDFDSWLQDFKITAKKNGISQKVIDDILSNATYLNQVILYDNKQPEFFEKTNEYINKRATKRAVNQAIIILNQNKSIFEKVEKDFNINKELILALWSTETNFGNNLGKMDIVSSLATLSFDKRRSQYFTEELLTLLKLVDKNVLKKENLFGSWAGALGNFQFMPSVIKDYAIDYDKNGNIDLKNSKDDAIASAANYLSKIGIKKDYPCFDEVKFEKDIDNKLFNFSAGNIHNKKTIIDWQKLGINFLNENSRKNSSIAALVLPDGDITSPKFLVYDNYEVILKWNRSLRFALSICSLSDSIKNEI
ncbi:MAG: lytic murein transglycosylase [Proteobacteria bacterium]|nr:lytic murein transglycosylase [Pseudomonadota bacterium]